MVGYVWRARAWVSVYVCVLGLKASNVLNYQTYSVLSKSRVKSVTRIHTHSHTWIHYGNIQDIFTLIIDHLCAYNVFQLFTIIHARHAWHSNTYTACVPLALCVYGRVLVCKPGWPAEHVYTCTYTSPTFTICRWPSIRLTAAVLWWVGGHALGWTLDDGSAFYEII